MSRRKYHGPAEKSRPTTFEDGPWYNGRSPEELGLTPSLSEKPATREKMLQERGIYELKPVKRGEAIQPRLL